MRTLRAVCRRTALGWAVSFASVAACALVPRAAVADAAVAVAHSEAGPADLALRRAALEQRAGRLRGVVSNLETIDFSQEPSFEGADRAAYLLGQAYLELGSNERFAALAGHVGHWPTQTPYTRWFVYQRALIETETGSPRTVDSGGVSGSASIDARSTGIASADALASALLLESGAFRAALDVLGHGDDSALALYMRDVAQSAAGKDDTTPLESLASADTSTGIGRDLAGLARINLATRALREGRDPTALLEGVAHASASASRAAHMLGVYEIERGDTLAGAARLERLLASDSTYSDRREVGRVLAGLSLDTASWAAAHERYATVDRDWQTARGAIERVLETGEFDPLWNAWHAQHPLAGTLLLDGEPVYEASARFARQAGNLTSAPEVALPELDLARSGTVVPDVPPPTAEEWARIGASGSVVMEIAAELQRTQWAIAQEQERLAAGRDYLDRGLGHLRREEALLVDRVAMLDSLRATLEALDARLRDVRDAASRRLAKRTGRVIATLEGHLVWLEAMRHFHIDGPNGARERIAPDGYPTADSLHAAETALANSIMALAERMAAGTPDLIARSYDEAWKPGLIDRIAVQQAQAHTSLALARALAASVDSNLATWQTSPGLERLTAEARHLAEALEARHAAHLALRDSIARATVTRALASLESEREAIDYGLAVAAYGMSVRLDLNGTMAGAVDSSGAAVEASSAGQAPEDELDDPATQAWRVTAVDHLKVFLDRHRQSPARAEMRFRLADLLLIDARQVFREKMARFIEAQNAGVTSAPLPVLDHGPALDLYRSILAEDPEFEHLDAVLFNAGMILADDGDPEAERYFDDLVTRYPQSAYVQESWLRMGDMRFNDKAFAASVERYAHAAEGGDPNLRAIALYKLGWAHFNEDRFLDAADAFRRVLDLYASAERPRIQADIEHESETYLVHSLARAGGADAFAGYFDGLGARPYEMHVLMAMADHFRRFSMYDEAIDADALVVDRYPLHPDALLSARRLPETRMRSDHADQARMLQLALAPLFAPGSDWQKAQSSDSVRAAGAAFARESWTSVALHHHLEARRYGRAEDWHRALELYDTMLRTFPGDAEAPQFQLYAGEASMALEDYAGSLAHYRAAADAGADSTAEMALRQRVAVTDAWYERTRGRSAGATGLGSDSLARAVIVNGDELLARFPAHDGGADIRWRQGHLALAHGWHDQAVDHFERLASEHPGDPRAPAAASLTADALFKLERFEAAGTAFEHAQQLARTAGNDSLARHAAEAIPVCAFRNAEAVAQNDSMNFERQATLFEQVASRWPTYEHAHLAQYRAGLAWNRAGNAPRAVMAMETLIREFPKSEYVKDAHLEIAATWEKAGEKEKAAEAFAAFAARFPKDSSSANAWLKSADLFAAAGNAPRAEAIRLDYIARYPDDVETAMEILEPLAQRDLETVGAARPLSQLTAVTKGATPSHLAEYLRRARLRPALASKELIAHVRFLEADEVRPAYLASRLTLPLDRSIKARQVRLDSLLARYRRTVDMGVATYAHAAAFRIGESLIAFGEALEQSERPADISGDDRLAYEDVLFEKAQAFYDRGEQVWEELLRQKGQDAGSDTWLADARSALWKRLGQRFYFRPEVEFPLVQGKAPVALRTEGTADTSGDTAGVAKREEHSR